jgi:hypothetical protein
MRYFKFMKLVRALLLLAVSSAAFAAEISRDSALVGPNFSLQFRAPLTLSAGATGGEPKFRIDFIFQDGRQFEGPAEDVQGEHCTLSVRLDLSSFEQARRSGVYPKLTLADGSSMELSLNGASSWTPARNGRAVVNDVEWAVNRVFESTIRYVVEGQRLVRDGGLESGSRVTEISCRGDALTFDSLSRAFGAVRYWR